VIYVKQFDAVVLVLVGAVTICVSACVPDPTLDIEPVSEAGTEEVVAALREIDVGEEVTLHFVTGESASGRLENWGYVSITLSRRVSTGWEQFGRVSESYETKYVHSVEVKPGRTEPNPRY
jgi:hypothetical protein